ncbi:MAG: N-6 DNA methylase [Bacteroidales bacterium]|jgi:adenine-specific DNA-methyltransferase|nr:N-6 DNA methylase [Bacteroidales bacterium]
MTSKKHTGSYYTPDYLSSFIIRRISMQLTKGKHISIFEPSVGDGSFLNALKKSDILKQYSNIQITALDINKNELDKAKNNIADIKCSKSFEHCDFLNYVKKEKRQYNLIIGNPPYIKKFFLYEKQIAICQEIHKEAKLSNNSIKNIWTAFLIKSIQLLENDGILAFVLPSELLQVKFAEELREYIKSQFQRVEIYTFSNLLFECKGQDTIILLGFKQSNDNGIFYTNIENKEQLSPANLTRKDILVKSDVKWTHHILDSDGLNFLHKVQQQLKPISTYCDSKPGIVTAANHFFIVDKDTEEKYGLGAYTQPIIQKGFFVNGSVVFDNEDYNQLLSDGKPARILCFKDEDKKYINKQVKSYLKLGEDADISDRYKCRIRKNWFVIPNISTPSDGFFFKRCHYYPKLLKNEANVLVTDSAYKVNMNKGHEINHLIYSFYNSLTLVFSELEGRYYGGGVLELTPMEFKKLPVPILPIANKKFESFTKSFEQKFQIEDILNKNDFSILNTSIGLNAEEVERIQKIRTKLIRKRMR